MSNTNLVIIQNANSTDNITQKEQKKFNQLTKKINAKRNLLVEYAENINQFKQVYATNYTPLMNEFNQHRTHMVYLLDEVYDHKLFSPTDRKKMSYMIETIVHAFTVQDEKLKQIYNTRCKQDYDAEIKEQQQDQLNLLKEMFKENFDIDIDLNTEDDQEELIRKIAQAQQKAEQEEDIREEERKTKNAKRKKNEQTLQKEALQLAEEQKITQSIREIFRQLAKTLHPDRRSEHLNHDQKTELMKRVNIAYSNQDLLSLLQIQLEIEQITQDDINATDVEQIKRFNKILKNQLNSLEDEIYDLCDSFMQQFNMKLNPSLMGPSYILIQLSHDIANVKESSKNLLQDIELWKTDLKTLKTYIKEEIKIPKFGDIEFMEF